MAAAVLHDKQRFATLLQPIKDLAQNWNIDVAKDLEEYLEELEQISISFDGGRTTFNFAEAALVIQGSAVVYSRKVEYLYALIYQTLDMITRRRQSKKKLTRGPNGEILDPDSDMLIRRTADDERLAEAEEEFLLLNDMDLAEGKNIDLAEHPEQVALSAAMAVSYVHGPSRFGAASGLGASMIGTPAAQKASAALKARTPLSMLTAGPTSSLSRQFGGEATFRVAAASMSRGGALLMEPRARAAASLLDLSTNTPQEIPTEAPDVQHDGLLVASYDAPEVDLGVDVSTANDGDWVTGGITSAVKPATRATQRAAAAAAPRVNNDSAAAQDRPAKDPWARLDPLVEMPNENKPFRRGRTFVEHDKPAVIAHKGPLQAAAETASEKAKSKKLQHQSQPKAVMQRARELAARAAMERVAGPWSRDRPAIGASSVAVTSVLPELDQLIEAYKQTGTKSSRRRVTASAVPAQTAAGPAADTDDVYIGGDEGYDAPEVDTGGDYFAEAESGEVLSHHLHHEEQMAGSATMAAVEQMYLDGGEAADARYEEANRALAAANTDTRTLTRLLQPDMRVRNPDDEEYLRRVEEHIRAFTADARSALQSSRMQRRVESWQQKLAPILAQEERRPEFDIHQYGDSVLSAMAGVTGVGMGDDIAQRGEVCRTDFAAVVATLKSQRFEVCRLFLATLQLANAGNVDIMSDAVEPGSTGRAGRGARGSPDGGLAASAAGNVVPPTFALNLLSTVRSQELDAYKAPSAALLEAEGGVAALGLGFTGPASSHPDGTGALPASFTKVQSAAPARRALATRSANESIAAPIMKASARPAHAAEDARARSPSAKRLKASAPSSPQVVTRSVMLR